jgi:hypothetical protein
MFLALVTEDDEGARTWCLGDLRLGVALELEGGVVVEGVFLGDGRRDIDPLRFGTLVVRAVAPPLEVVDCVRLMEADRDKWASASLLSASLARRAFGANVLDSSHNVGANVHSFVSLSSLSCFSLSL